MTLGTYWKPLAAVLLLAVLTWQAYSIGHKRADAHWQIKWAQRDAADMQAKAGREAAERAEEQRRQQAMIGVIQNADQQIAQAKADAVGASAAADSLRGTIATLRRLLANSETSRLSAAAAASTSRTDARLLLADVLEKSVERNEQLAAYADRARIAGQACEGAYERVMEGQ